MNSSLNSEISNYLFDKNKFSLSKPCGKIKNKNLEYCKNYSKIHNKPGFNFKGNNNVCLLYKNNIPTNNFDSNFIQKYSLKKFIKNKNQKNANIYQQNNPKYYFKELNHYNLKSSGLLEKKNVENIENCMNSCLNNPSCKSITYGQESMECTFYDKINLHNNTNKNFDTYTYKINNKNNICDQDKDQHTMNNKNIQEYNINLNNKQNYIKNHDIFEVNNDKYTNCFTNEIYNNMNDTLKNYNKICKQEFGDEYAFSNLDNHHNVVECESEKDDKKIKILCTPQFSEKYTNMNNNNNNKNVNENMNEKENTKLNNNINQLYNKYLYNTYSTYSTYNKNMIYISLFIGLILLFIFIYFIIKFKSK